MESLKTVLRDALPQSVSHEKRVTIIGLRGSSKTTMLGCIALACESLRITNPTFKYNIIEKSSGLMQVPSDLRRGRFPQATPAGTVYEAEILLKWGEMWGKKILHLPFCETAGEDIQKMVSRFKTGMYNLQTEWGLAESVYRYICDSNGFILVAPVSRADFPWGRLENHPDDEIVDCDTQIARVLGAIFDYKMESKSPPIEGLAVLLTKCDMLTKYQSYFKSNGMDFYTEQGMINFMNTYFSATASKLDFYGLEKVRFFPMHVETEKDEEGNARKWPGGGDKIKVNVMKRLPFFNQEVSVDLIKWLKQTFAK